MISFNPYWGGLDYVEEDSVPPDGFAITFTPSIANDSTAGALQMGWEIGANQFLQHEFRAAAENMNSSGLFVSAFG